MITSPSSRSIRSKGHNTRNSGSRRRKWRNSPATSSVTSRRWKPFGDAFQGFIPDQFGLQGKDAVEQFTLLANSFLYQRMDFYQEIKRNHKAVFLNYPYWHKHEFQNEGLKKKVLQAIKEGWLNSFPKIPLVNPPGEQAAAGPHRGG